LLQINAAQQEAMPLRYQQSDEFTAFHAAPELQERVNFSSNDITHIIKECGVETRLERNNCKQLFDAPHVG
jgi:hypothetical protein